MAAPLYTTSSGLLWHAGKILIVVAGLPARGKTHISRSLERYLRWNGVTTEVYSLGDYRRKLLGHAKDLPPDYFTYGPKSPETEHIRSSVRSSCERDILDFFEHAGQVAIYDANNGTRESRKKLYDKFHPVGIHVIFLESVCSNQDIVLSNIRSVKISSPDYANWNPDQAVEDYMRRINEHERHYEPVEEMDIPWIRLFNVGEKIEVNKIQGYLQSRIVFFLMNIHNRHRFIYFARSGQSLIEHSYRADSDLSPAGWDYARRLKNFMLERRYLNMEERMKNNGGIVEDRNLVIWTSSRRRSHHTAWPFIKDGTIGTIDNSKSPHRATLDLNSSPRKMQTPIGSSVPTRPQSELNTYGVNTPITMKMSSPAQLDLLLPQPHEEGITVTAPSSPPPGLSIPSGQSAYSRIKVIEKSRLCEINPGVWDGLSPDDVRTRYPLEWENFLRDPYGHRAPRAESYHDLCVRLEPILIELEDCKDDLLIVSHASVIRCLLAYLVGLPAHEVPAVDIARGDLIEVQPSAYGVKTRMFHFWSGPGRKDADTALSGLEGEMKSKDLPPSLVASGFASPSSGKSDVSSPPKSVLHLDRCYMSHNPSTSDLGESLRRTKSREEIMGGAMDGNRSGSGASSPSAEPMVQKLESKSPPINAVDLPPPTSTRVQHPKLSHPKSHLSQSFTVLDDSPTTTTNPTAQMITTLEEVEGEEFEFPIHASKVLPKVEPSLGTDEAATVAAKIEAADTRPTFYENVVEGAVKRKKPTTTLSPPTSLVSPPNLNSSPKSLGSPPSGMASISPRMLVTSPGLISKSPNAPCATLGGANGGQISPTAMLPPPAVPVEGASGEAAGVDGKSV